MYLLNFQDVGAKKDANIFLMVCTPENRAGIKYAITFGCPRNNSTPNLINIEKVIQTTFQFSKGIKGINSSKTTR